MAPISPPTHFPVAIKIAGGLNPERTIFIDGGVPRDTKWFDISLQCGPSLTENDDIAFRLVLSFFDNHTIYLTNSSIKGVWDDEKARKYEMKAKQLITIAEFETDDMPSTSSQSLIELLRCTLAEKAISQHLNSTQSEKSVQNTQNDHEGNQPQNETSIQLKLSAEMIPLKNTDQEKGLSQKNLSTETTEKDPHKKPSENLHPSKTTRNFRSDQKEEHFAQHSSKHSSTKASHNESRANKSVSTMNGFINIYVPNLTQLRGEESRFMDPNQELVRFSNKLAELEAKRLSLDKYQGSQDLENDVKYSFEELGEIEMHRGKPFSMALECLENGYLAFLNGDLFCVYPHHFDYRRVTYIVFNGSVDLEQVEIGGGNGPDRTLVVDLYDEVVWSDAIVVLTDENFDELVLGSDEMWMVDAYTAWCPACQQLQPVWESAANKLRGKVMMGASDCDRNEKLTDDMEVKYFPTIFCYPKGKKSIDSYQVYQGRYEENYIVPWVLHELNGGNEIFPQDTKDEQKLVARTLRKKKRGLMQRKGYLSGGYGYILRKDGEYADQHETSSTKLIYMSHCSQTDKPITKPEKPEGEGISCSCDVM